MTHSFTKITASSAAYPSQSVSNDDLKEIFETSDEWIYSRTGIHQRRLSSGEMTSDLAIQVAEGILETANLTPNDLDFIIVGTMTPDFHTPSVACQVQGAIHAEKAFAFDVSAACSGFVYGLSVADAFISSGKYQRGLVIGAETLSQVLDWQDRSTAVLFGDAAGGVLVEKSASPGIVNQLLEANGAKGQALTAGAHSNLSPFVASEAENYFLQMDGRDIFDFALRDVSRNISEAIHAAGWTLAEVDYLLLHQANARIIEKIARKTKIPLDKFLMNMADYGNTSAASIPLLFHEELTKGTLEIGSKQKVVLTGYGGGLTWGSTCLVL